MRLLLALAAMALAGALPASALTVRESALAGTSGGYDGSDTVVLAPILGGAYQFSARARGFRYRDAFPGTQEEYSAAVRRELFHASVRGRVGTAPPNAQRAAYHLARGGLLFTFYGLTLGPEDAESAGELWEAEGPAPAPGSFDTAWVTSLGVVYTNTNHHIEADDGITVVVQNTWQFELRETWRETTTLAVQGGGNRYNNVLEHGVKTVYLNQIDYPGGGMAVRGWPNNYAGVSLRQALWGGLSVSGGWTRLSLLDGQLEALAGGELEWRPGGGWFVAAGWFHRHRRRVETRGAGSLSLAYSW